MPPERQSRHSGGTPQVALLIHPPRHIGRPDAQLFVYQSIASDVLEFAEMARPALLVGEQLEALIHQGDF
jgi:hypothetical protein